jgi:site-specific recombinase XerD
MRRVLNFGMETSIPTLVRDASMVMFMFVFGCRAYTAVSLRDADIDVTDERVTAVLVHRKGKRKRDPLVLQYDQNPTKVFARSPLALLRQ